MVGVGLTLLYSFKTQIVGCCCSGDGKSVIINNITFTNDFTIDN